MNSSGGRKTAGPLEFRFGEFASRVEFVHDGSTVLALPDGPALIVADAGFLAARRRELALPAGASVVSVPPGEAGKSWERAGEILHSALERRLDRDGTILGVGGGVVCDLAAFCASVYMRGCGLVLAPTSLLAMVDATLGGKTGVNFGGYKNLVGTFYPAREIRIWIETLSSLPERELLSGVAEAVKTALLGDPELLSLLDRRRAALLGRDSGLLAQVVRRCLTVKGRIVEQDFREGGRRAVLNLGHTFAHALESVAGLGLWSHGEAVAWGLARAARLGELLGVTPDAHAAAIRAVLSAYGFRTGADAGVPPERLVEAMSADKKRRGGELRLVLQRGIGDTVVQAVAAPLVLETLRGD
ncbi:MAG: 3-dehydroquinate synthase [Spirochaetales bacterium]|nr:3-dehydroquinate synthase [Spirochaetales bacterium]